MSYRITRKEVAKQFIIAIQLLLEWIEQGEDSNKKKDISPLEENPPETHLLTATEVAKILNVSKSFAYRLIQSGEISNISIGRSVRVREEDLNEFVSEHR